MSTDEVRLLLAMARDSGYEPNQHRLDPHTVGAFLKGVRTNSVNSEAYHEFDDEGEISKAYFYFDDLIGFLRQQCLWDDGLPNMEKYQEWLPILSQPEVTICDLNAETWGRLLATATAEKLAQ
jgi:hypothetical protein